MRVKIWGARGSIPTPIRPEEVREKIVSAILNISKIENGKFREELIAAILEEEQAAASLEKERREIVAAYLDKLSPLGGKTAGGNTPCIEIRSDDDLFIIDAGSGIRQLGLDLMQGPWGQGKGIIHLFFSHPHWDHIQGFPFFRPAFIPGNKIFVYGVHDMEAALRRQQESISFPVSLDYMQAEMTFVHLEPDETLEFGDLRVCNKRNDHPGDAYSFRFEKGDKVFVYASDAAYPTGTDLRPHIDFFADANVLIFDAQFTQRESDEKEDWGHSSSFVGVEMAQAASVENMLLYHYDPTYTDGDLEKILADTLKFQQNQYPGQKPVNVMIAQEGQLFDLTPAQSTQLKQVPGGNVAILKPTGIFDEQVVAELKAQLETLRQDEPISQLIIDMSEVEMLQVTGLRALVRFRKETMGAQMALAGPSINVQQLIELAGYIDFFAIYPSVHTALKALRVRETLNLPGQSIKNRYYIEEKIGEGILGTVFRAKDTRLNQPVAVKFLSASFSEEAIEQFLEHARQIIDLEHPNIVNIYACDEEQGLSFMVEELVESNLLRDLIDERAGHPVPFDLALTIAHDIALGLEYAHGHGVFHGDLKPKNVLLAEQVKISDFGLGRLESGKSLLNLDVPLALVTAHYLAPEQVLGHPIDARTDLYALGVIMYELFTGQRPFEGDDEAVLQHHRDSVPRPPRELNPQLSCSLEHLILKLLDKDPTKRYATAQRVRRILASIAPSIGQTAVNRYARPVLAGREEPLAQLTQLWTDTQSGQGQVAFITGETGIGKTRLALELAQHVAADGGLVLMGHCPQAEVMSAYRPFVEALNNYLAQHAPAEDDPVKQALTQLGEYKPEILQLISHRDTAAKNETGPNFDIITLARIFARATQERPWLLVIDDLQWADSSTLQLLNYLGRHCEQMKLMIVGVYTTPQDEGKVDDDEPLAALHNDLSRFVSAETIILEHLPQGKVKEMLENLWSQSVPLDLVAAIYRRTQGSPLFVGEVARMLVDVGTAVRRDGRWRLSSVMDGDLPENVQEAVLRRFNGLSKETQTVLSQAAILGPRFRFQDLHEMSDLSAWDALENLDIALERQLMREVPSEGVLRFKHPLIQQVLYDNLSELKQRLLHREAGEALERRYPDEKDTLAPVLAHHFIRAELFDKGFIYSLQAAHQAEVVYAGQTALFWYNRALDMLERMTPTQELTQHKIEILLARERIYSWRGQRKAQAADLVMLQTLAQTSSDPAQLALIHNRRGAYERIASRFVEAAVEVDAALQAARKAGDPDLEGESLVQMAHIATHQGDFDAVCDQLQTAQECFARAKNRRGEARCLNALGTIYRYLNDYALAEDQYLHALDMNQESGHWPGQAACLSNLGAWHQETGDYAGAAHLSRQALEINRFIGHRRGEAICLHRLALIDKALGHYDTARDYLQQALTIRQAIEDNQGEAEDLRALGAIALDQEDHETAREYIGQALEMFQRLKLHAYEADTWLVLGLALEGLGECLKAQHAYEQAQAIHEKVGREAGAIEARVGLTRCMLANNKIEQARQEIEICLNWLKPHAALGIMDPVRLYLTAYRVLEAAEDTEEMEKVLQAGLALLRHHADNIDDPELRASFLEAVPVNKELLAL